MNRNYAHDFVDGVEVPPLVVAEDGKLPSGHRGGIHVESARVTLIGTHQGSLWLWGTSVLDLHGTHQGSLHAHDQSRATIHGQQQGSTHVADQAVVAVPGSTQGSMHTTQSGEIAIEVGGRHQGSVHNEGRYILRGTRGGSYSGDGEYLEEPGSRVVQPRIVDGMTVNEW